MGCWVVDSLVDSRCRATSFVPSLAPSFPVELLRALGGSCTLNRIDSHGLSEPLSDVQQNGNTCHKQLPY